jgi:transposase-like protein
VFQIVLESIERTGSISAAARELDVARTTIQRIVRARSNRQGDRP